MKEKEVFWCSCRRAGEAFCSCCRALSFCSKDVAKELQRPDVSRSILGCLSATACMISLGGQTKLEITKLSLHSDSDFQQGPAAIRVFHLLEVTLTGNLAGSLSSHRSALPSSPLFSSLEVSMQLFIYQKVNGMSVECLRMRRGLLGGTVLNLVNARLSLRPSARYF